MSNEKLLLSSEQGIATLFANMMSNKLVIYNKQGDGYLYDEEIMKYYKKLKCVLVDMIPTVLIPIIDEVIYNIKEDLDYDDEYSLKKTKDLKNIKFTLQTLRGCQTIYKTAIPKLLNTNFKKNIETPICKKETIKYKDEDYTQTILKFIKEKCIESPVNKEKYKVQPQVLYNAYKEYCENNNITETNINKFGIFISNKFGKNKQLRLNGKHVRFYFGIELL
jgi:hypothetical protein